MIKKTLLFIFFILFTITIFSCRNDDDSNIPDPDEMEVEINKPPIINQQYFQVSETITSEVDIAKVIASDPEDEPISFRIIGNNSTLFKINETNGILRLKNGENLNFIESEAHNIIVEVSDGELKSSAQITINVLDSTITFITTWKVEYANGIITIPISGCSSNDFDVDWGDDTISYNQTSVLSHTYENPGEYTVEITGEFCGINFQFYNNLNNNLKIISLDQWGNTKWKNMNRAFYNCSLLVNNASDFPNLEDVEDMSYMFFGASSFNGDLNNWNVGNVKDMSYMFFGASSFNGNISDWNVRNVTNMTGMFREASNFNGDLNNWVVDNVTNMFEMFKDATTFNKDLNNWNVSKVTEMSSMFLRARSFNGNIQNWDISSIKFMSRMFIGAYAFDQYLGAWDINNVLSMDNMLYATNMSVVNYDQTLKAWSELTNVPHNVDFSSEGRIYCNEGFLAREILKEKGWNFTGDYQGSINDCN